MKNYLMASNFHSSNITPFLDTRPEIKNWMTINLCIIITSNLACKELSEIIHHGLPNMQFILTELDPGKTYGWMIPHVWDFVNNPKPSGLHGLTY